MHEGDNMLTSFRINNFKAWRDTGEIRLAPLTVIFGANSAGKSSLGHLLLALKQTALSSDRRRALNLGDGNSLIDLGTFRDCVFNHDLAQPLTFHLAWELKHGFDVKDPLQQVKYRGDELALDVELRAGQADRPEVASLEFTLRDKGGKTLDVAYQRKESGVFDMKSEIFKFVRASGRVWSLDEPEKFYRISDQARARFQNAGFLADFALATESMLSQFYYLGPLREHPRRIYPWSGDTPESVGLKGEYVIAAILAAQGEGRRLNRGPKLNRQFFAEFIASWLKEIGIIHSFSVKPVSEGRKEYEVLVKTHAKASEVKITDVGFGVSQVLPALVQAFYCPPGSVVWMEQPEIHLHPQVQAELADVFISAIQAREDGADRNIQLIIESHSEHFLNRLQRRIAEGGLSPDDVAIYFCKRSETGTELEPLRLNIFGDIENWPENFFGNDMADLTARTIAAIDRQQQEQAK
jgi:predicted ATPase